MASIPRLHSRNEKEEPRKQKLSRHDYSIEEHSACVCTHAVERQNVRHAKVAVHRRHEEKQIEAAKIFCAVK
jgi:hypothetical protein